MMKNENAYRLTFTGCLILSAIMSYGCVDADQIGNLCTDSPVGKTAPGICGCNVSDAPDPKTGIPSCLNKTVDYCPDDPDKTLPGICGCGISDDPDETGVIQCLSEEADYCPDDPKKTLPGICGCGIEDVFDEATKTYTCIAPQIDLCPDDPLKTLPGICGCGVKDEKDSANQFICIMNNVDNCPDDPLKTLPGVCGCGVSDNDLDEYGIPKCKSGDVDYCPTDPNKKVPGICGCGIKDEGENLEDPDGDSFANCIDFCNMDPNKQDPGVCGCGIKDEGFNIEDPDGDGYANCVDACPANGEVHELMDGCTCEREVFRYGRIMCAIRNLEELKEAYDNQAKQGALKEYFIFDMDLSKEAPTKWPPDGRELGQAGESLKTVKFSLYGENTKIISSQPLHCKSEKSCSFLGNLDKVTIQGLNINLNFIMDQGTYKYTYGTGALAGYAKDTTIKDTVVKVTFEGFDNFQYVGGVIGKALNVAFDNVDVDSTIVGKTQVGGLVGLVSSGGSVVNSFVQTSLKASNPSSSAMFGGIAGATESASVRFNILNSAAIIKSLNYSSANPSVAGLVGNASGLVYIHNSYAAGQLEPTDKVTDLVYFDKSYNKDEKPKSYLNAFAQKDWQGKDVLRMYDGFDCEEFCFTLKNGELKISDRLLKDDLTGIQLPYNNNKGKDDPFYNNWVEVETKIAGTSYKVPRPKKRRFSSTVVF